VRKTVLKEIFVPININYKTALDFSRQLKRVNLSQHKKVAINIRNFAKSNGRIEPFSALMIINSIKAFHKLASENNVDVSLLFIKEQAIINKYAKHLRFYSSLNLPIGDPPSEDYIGSSVSSFIPIMKVDVSGIKMSPDEHGEIKSISSQISTVASRGNKEIFKYLDFCIIEIIRNVIEHSESKHLWYAAQYWSTDNCVEISIMDEGMGIQTSLENELGDEEKLLKFSLIPGCSSKPTTHYIGDHADNSGFGLYMISEIGKSSGDFIISSNSESLKISNSEEDYTTCLLSGTIIRLRLYIEELKNYETQKEDLIKKGLKVVEKYNKYRETKRFAPGLPVTKFF
jgi:hypothetical protein